MIINVLDALRYLQIADSYGLRASKTARLPEAEEATATAAATSRRVNRGDTLTLPAGVPDRATLANSGDEVVPRPPCSWLPYYARAA